MNKYLPYAIIAFAVVAAAYMVFVSTEKTKQNTGEPNIPRWETKKDEQPPVAMQVTPLELDEDAKTWKFKIAFETHSGSLDDDPLEVVVLRDDKGNTFQPILWEGPGAGGHHRAGILTFNAVSPTPPFVELKIINVGGIPERVFTWNIQ